MGKITTPMAILISGILIALVIYAKPVLRYDFDYINTELSMRFDKVTGESCLLHNYARKEDVDTFKKYLILKECE
jgi:hypothetical protein